MPSRLASRRAEVLGLVGESGSGKTSLAWGIMRYLPRGAKESGRISLQGKDLTAASSAEIDAIRGRRIGMVFQDPGAPDRAGIAVMYRGDIVELIDVADLAAGARHAYTRSLLAAVPAPLAIRN